MENSTQTPQEESNLEDLASVFSGPALFTNRFYLSVYSDVVRLSFMEMVNPSAPKLFRTAVVMSLADAKALHGLLEDMIVKKDGSN